jgi:hypothetical protein
MEELRTQRNQALEQRNQAVELAQQRNQALELAQTRIQQRNQALELAQARIRQLEHAQQQDEQVHQQDVARIRNLEQSVELTRFQAIQVHYQFLHVIENSWIF